MRAHGDMHSRMRSYVYPNTRRGPLQAAAAAAAAAAVCRYAFAYAGMCISEYAGGGAGGRSVGALLAAMGECIDPLGLAAAWGLPLGLE